MLSPMFGGGTANVELEVLTGLSMRFFPEGAIPYNTEINQPTGDWRPSWPVKGMIRPRSVRFTIGSPAAPR